MCHRRCRWLSLGRLSISPKALASLAEMRLRTKEWARRLPGVNGPEFELGTRVDGPSCQIVRAGHNLKKMTIGIIEIQSPAAVVQIGFAGALFARIGPVLKPSVTNTSEDPVELVLTDQKR